MHLIFQTYLKFHPITDMKLIIIYFKSETKSQQRNTENINQLLNQGRKIYRILSAPTATDHDP